MIDPVIRSGLEVALIEPAPVLARGGRFGLLLNQASVDRSFRLACDVLASRFPGQLAALFSPQHGLWGEEQANMIESPHSRYAPLDLPVYSLYSETRRPTPEMLRGLDCLVIDLQDVGTRVYTFIWTVQQCLVACAEAQLPAVILDRPNPLGPTSEGPLLEPEYRSFVGGWPIPLRHGLSLGELAQLVNREQSIGADLTVVPYEAGSGQEPTADGFPWVPPSPNMPRRETAVVYPGMVLFEGTNVSEGRGTTLPFERLGAPWIDPYVLARKLAAYEHPGLAVAPVRFVPTFDKFRGQACGGISLHVTDPSAVRSVATAVAILATISRLYPAEFAWLPPPYEYETEKPPIDILFGSPALRERLADPRSITPAEIASLVAFDEPTWQQRVSKVRIYNHGRTSSS
jgi:uncharacterized protein YbbC (DUF1343 family)